MDVLSLEQIYLYRGNFFLQDINFVLRENEIVLLEGNSGAGKSTLIHLIGNSIQPDFGRITYFGKERYEAEQEIRKKTSILYDVPNFNKELKAKRLAKEIKKFEEHFDMEAFHNYMQIFSLEETKKVKHYSTGMQKKFMLSIALSRKPELLVMDELTSGVDEESRVKMLEQIKLYQNTHTLTVLFSTHNPKDRDIATRIQKMEDGRFV